jgi:hypothetical protein
MYCQSCGNEIAVELKYCSRCGANLSTIGTVTQIQAPPVKLVVPSIVLGATIIFSLGMIVTGATQLANAGLPPGPIMGMLFFCSATLFGCIALMIRFWTNLITLQRQTITTTEQPRPSMAERPAAQQLPPRLDPVPSVTEHTTRTFSPVYSEQSDRGTKEY